jgi:hypothetical protein
MSKISAVVAAAVVAIFVASGMARAADEADTRPSTRPTPPAWMARDPGSWPQILLTNDLRFSDRTYERGASAFLMRLPNGVVVGATAKHVVGIDNLAEVKSKLKTWAVLRPNTRSNGDRIGMTELAEKVTEGSSADWFVMVCASQAGPWPGEPLPASAERVEVGETVYVLAVPEGDQSRQRVYKGVVTQADGSGEFYYKIAEAPQSKGFSGAPIIDAYGRLTGFHSGHSDTPGTYYGYDTASLLPLIQLPANVHAVAVSEQNSVASGARGTDAPAGRGGSAADDQAEAIMRTAQLLIDNKMYDKAAAKLQTVIKTFPGTAAAAKAQQMLLGLQNQ